MIVLGILALASPSLNESIADGDAAIPFILLAFGLIFTGPGIGLLVAYSRSKSKVSRLFDNIKTLANEGRLTTGIIRDISQSTVVTSGIGGIKRKIRRYLKIRYSFQDDRNQQRDGEGIVEIMDITQVGLTRPDVSNYYLRTDYKKLLKTPVKVAFNENLSLIVSIENLDEILNQTFASKS